jgi:hypothetical protein
MKTQVTKTIAPKVKSTLESTLTNYAKYHQQRVDKMQDQLKENFVYHFPWIGEDLYKETYLISYYNSMLVDLVVESEDNVLEYTIANLKHYLRSSYNVRENSSGSLHREVSTWKFQANMDLLDQLEKFAKNNN